MDAKAQEIIALRNKVNEHKASSQKHGQLAEKFDAESKELKQQQKIIQQDINTVNKIQSSKERIAAIKANHLQKQNT